MQTLTQKNILVTGAGGFIGSHLIEQLVPRCARLTAMIHYDSRADWGNLEYLPDDIKQNLEVVAADINDPHQTQRLMQGKDIVFHLAALISIPFSYQAPASFYQTNALGTINVMEAARTLGTERVVITSTSETYGTARTVPMTEEHPLQAQSPYAASKIAADKAAESFYCSYNLPVVTVRPFNAYGPRQSARAIVPTIITQALSDSPEIKLGTLSPVRDLTFAQDTVEGFIAAATAGNAPGNTYNIGYGSGISIGDLAQTIKTLTGRDKPIVADEQRVRPGKSEVMQLVCDSSKARAELGWQPQHTLEQGLQKTIDFIRQYPHVYKSDRYLV